MASGERQRDPRFENFASDPRYRLPSRKQTQIKLDKRFSRLLKDEEFVKKGSKGVRVDRFGRPVAAAKAKANRALNKQFELGSDDSDTSSEDGSGDEGKAGYDPARQGGFDDSSSSSSSSGSEESDVDDEEEEEQAEDFLAEVQDDEAQEAGEVTTRLAIVNMDFDNLRAIDIFVVAASLCPPNGKILNVSIYPSEFGKERMERERTQGPAPELFSNSTARNDASLSESEDDDEKVRARLMPRNGEETSDDVDKKALRRYQLQRLRYFYAVVTCDSTSTAQALYNEMDGREYLTTANFFDLRFVPDEVTFDDDKPKEECTSAPDGYKPNEFVTEALTHSKVRLTWDEEDRGRKEIQKRAFARGEVEDNDLKAYIGTDSSEDEDEAPDEAVVDATAGKSDGKDAARKKLRAALGLSDSPQTSVKKKAEEGGVQVTFSAALTSSKPARSRDIHTSREDIDETTKEKYVRKERERKERRKANARALRETAGESTNLPALDHRDDGIEDAQGGVNSDKDDPFDDPFFENPRAANEVAKQASKKARRIDVEAEEAAAAEIKARERAELELLVADGEENVREFDMDDIKRSEKAARKGRKGHKKHKNEALKDVQQQQQQQDVDMADPRFASAIFGNHEYAVDPTQPHFVGTRSMKALLEEARHRPRSRLREDEEDARDASSVTVGASRSNKKRRVHA